MTRVLGATLFCVGLCACSGGAGGTGPASANPADMGPRTAMFSGLTRIANNGACSSLSARHEIDAGAGTVTVTLTQAGAPRLQLQVCALNELNHNNCTIPPFATLPLGQSVSALVKGGRSQAVTLYPEGCGGADATPGDPIAYSVTVVYPG